MYHYLLCAYQQWCDGKSIEEIESSSEDFVEMIHKLAHYDKQILREFLSKQPWYYTKVK
jgi:NifU-like protein involved in Fe-S cluster formation